MGIIILIAISVSLDTFGIGMAYTLAGIKIPKCTKLLLLTINGIFTMAAVLLGKQLCEWIPNTYFQMAGGGVLVVMGARTLWNALGENKTTDYDKDNSRILEPWEGIVLGVSMALDSVCAGLSIVDSGLVMYFFPIFTVLASGAFLTLGEKITVNLRRLNGISGCILILLGIFRLYF